MAEEAFPLPGSSFKQLERIISAYAEIKDEATPAEVAKLTGTDSTNVSRNNKFLVAVGLVEGTLKKKVTAFGERLGRAIQYQQVVTEDECWKELVAKSDFFQKTISAVRIRRGMDSTTLTNHIAFSAGVSKNAAMMAGAGAVLEILVRSGSLVESGGVLTVQEEIIGADAEKKADMKAEVSFWDNANNFFQPVSASGSIFVDPKVNRQKVAEPRRVTLRIQLNINCTPSDLDSLGVKLRKLLTDVEGPDLFGEDSASEDGQSRSE